jgi:uncharacterized protein (TIGR03435 family)
MCMAMVLAVAVAFAQPQTTFEVASIKLSGPQSIRGLDGGPGSRDPGRYSFGQATVLDLLSVAYGLDGFQISGKTALDEQRFDLVAKIPQGTTKEEFKSMMQSLLAERFHLKMHMDSKEFPAFELLVANGGLKLKETDPGAPPAPKLEGFPDLPAGRPGMTSTYRSDGGITVVRLRAQQQTLAALARMVRQDGPPILDKTGVAGKFDFTLEYTIEHAGAALDATVSIPIAPGLPTALRQQLGLQLVPKKALFDVLVVDSIDKAPTEN